MKKNHIYLEQLCENARYSENLETVINSLNAIEILHLEYESDYQGYVDIDVLLKNGKVFIYDYYYGSCSGCDEWEARNLSNEEIEQEMLRAAVLYDIKDYIVFLKQRKKYGLDNSLKDQILHQIYLHFPEFNPLPNVVIF